MVKFISNGLDLVVLALILGACVAPAAEAAIAPLVGAAFLRVANFGASFLVSVITLKNFAVQWMTPNITEQELSKDDLSPFSFNIAGFNDAIRDIRQGIQFDNQMSSFKDGIEKIDQLFKEYIDISPSFDPILSYQTKFSNYVYFTFQHKVLSSIRVSEILSSLLSNINPHYNGQAGLANIFFEQTKNVNDMCRTKLSQMQQLSGLFGLITITQQKAIHILKFAHRIGEWSSRDLSEPYEERKDAAGFERELNVTMNVYRSCVKRFVELFGEASTEIHNCDRVGGHVKDVTYTELEDVFQQYIISEASVYPIGKCPQNCSGISNRKVTTFLTHRKQTDKLTFVEDAYNCSGYLRECKILNNNNLAKICISNAQDRRFDFAIFKEKDYRQCSGKLKAGKRIDRITNRLRMPPMNENPTCPQCECTCENGRPGGNLQYFSLTESYSTAWAHYVVTGIRFHRVGDTIQLQIQEGQVLPFGGVNASTLRWMENPIEKDNRVAITDGFKEIALDKVMVPDNFVVTGVKLDKIEDILRLKVFFQRYDRILGKLSMAVLNQIGYPTIREEVQQLNYKKLAINSDQPNNEISGYEKFISFRSSDLEQDGGQTTVPLIDIQNVTSNVPTPLSGIGITHRRNMQSSGFLGLSIFTFNIVAEISEEKLHLESS